MRDLARPSRRDLLTGLVGVGVLGGLSACGVRGGTSLVGPDSITAAEAARQTTGRTASAALRARAVDVDLGGRVVSTWAYGDTLPGKAIRVTEGDRIKIDFTNSLPIATSVHWHGLAIRNDMDGVPGVTTPEIAPGANFTYTFVVPDAGTHWFHPHSGLQLDRGLYAPFIVDAPTEPGGYDAEWIIVLDDWTDGVGRSPEDILAGLKSAGSGSGGMSGMGMGGMSGMGMDGGDVTYPLYLINGRISTDPDVLTAQPGDRIRLRIINAGADTIFNVALGGHELRVTHSDGYAVVPVTTEALRIGMGERYDAVVTLKDGVFPFEAVPVGKSGSARALVRTGAGAVPPVAVRSDEIQSYPLTVDALRAAPGAALPQREPASIQDVRLSGTMKPYTWTINGRTYDDTVPLTITEGQVGRLKVRNQSMMAHPLHLHGHSFQIGAAGGRGPRKDTVLIPPMGGVSVDFAADNPGRWMVHCHNAYHAEAGMMTRLEYVT